jgi:hypothetical protein
MIVLAVDGHGTRTHQVDDIGHTQRVPPGPGHLSQGVHLCCVIHHVTVGAVINTKTLEQSRPTLPA